jgi:hypothetical protein
LDEHEPRLAVARSVLVDGFEPPQIGCGPQLREITARSSQTIIYLQALAGLHVPILQRSPLPWIGSEVP